MARSPLILIQCCAADRGNGRQLAARMTWLREWGHLVNAKFVLGAGNDCIEDDEIIFPSVRDDYFGTPWKTQGSMRWALDGGHDYAFICTVDTWINVPNLLETNWHRADYIGSRVTIGGLVGHAAGGNGYWVSERAMYAVATAGPVETWDDVWVSDTLKASRITLEDDASYGNGAFTLHAKTAAVMRAYHDAR